MPELTHLLKFKELSSDEEPIQIARDISFVPPVGSVIQLDDQYPGPGGFKQFNGRWRVEYAHYRLEVPKAAGYNPFLVAIIECKKLY